MEDDPIPFSNHIGAIKSRSDVIDSKSPKAISFVLKNARHRRETDEHEEETQVRGAAAAAGSCQVDARERACMCVRMCVRACTGLAPSMREREREREREITHVCEVACE